MDRPPYDIPAEPGESADGWAPQRRRAAEGFDATPAAAASPFDALMAEFTLRAEAAGLDPAADVAPPAVVPPAVFPPVAAQPVVTPPIAAAPPGAFPPAYGAPVAAPPAEVQPPVVSSAISEGHDAIPSYPLPGYAQPPAYEAPSYRPVDTWEEPASEPTGFELLGLAPTPEPVSPIPAEPVAVAEAAPIAVPVPVSVSAGGGAYDDALTEALPVVPPQAPAYPPVSTAAAFPAPTRPSPALSAPAPAPMPPPTGERFSHAVAIEPEPFDTSTLTVVERAALDNADSDLIASLQQVVLQRGSDLHVTVNAAPTLRVDGSLRPALEDVPWSRNKVTSALMSLLNERQAEKFAEAMELDFAFTISANARFRVNFYQQRGAIGAAFRLIPTEIKQLKALGVPDVVAKFATLPRGLVLVTGPTGSGKSTTLAALIDLVNETRADHIVTVEDPIEFMHTHKKSLVNQREVGADTHSFTAALKHVLRQDPDVILVGELRDLETISVALTAAETGHLVFATLHTQSAPQTVDRIIDVFPPHQQEQVRAQLALTLQGVVCQTLVKRASNSGRAVATEIMVTTPAVSNLIREGQTHQITAAMQAGGQFGMRTLEQHLAELVNAGTITHAAAAEKAQDQESLRQLVTRTDSGHVANALSTGINYNDAFADGPR
ncbi:PilT/PilU family type 4a pilus ATPase [Microterricola pindariensis]|uniref:PilT/PilU family type 4a pilus ATPase n=1 Tax=Microterricola pindariensis TaxID=478010 RepID=UPI0026A2E52B|nr:PilT/PilU family type 4a pilus ATPase [Microterricola pindariensis]